jgi:aldehyde dehydrogenase (NAD+)
VKRLARAAVENIKMGDPRDKDVTLGPLASTRQYKRVQEYIKSGIEEGAELVTALRRSDHQATNAGVAGLEDM